MTTCLRACVSALLAALLMLHVGIPVLFVSQRAVRYAAQLDVQLSDTDSTGLRAVLVHTKTGHSAVVVPEWQAKRTLSPPAPLPRPKPAPPPGAPPL